LIDPKKILVVQSNIDWWGFPKGAREVVSGNKIESNLACGLRELEEETGITKYDIKYALSDGKIMTIICDHLLLYVACSDVTSFVYNPNEIKNALWCDIKDFMAIDNIPMTETIRAKKVYEKLWIDTKDTIYNILVRLLTEKIEQKDHSDIVKIYPNTCDPLLMSKFELVFRWKCKNRTVDYYCD
jgi:8-oxo-dGTP pyrophosphatase MutT (NUDIX family)